MKAIDTAAYSAAVQELEALLFQKLLGQILDRMRQHRRKHGCNEMAHALEAPAHIVSLAMLDLAEAGRVVIVDRIFGQPLYKLVELGTCEWCGLYNPRLVGGECPTCADLFAQGVTPAQARRVC